MNDGLNGKLALALAHKRIVFLTDGPGLYTTQVFCFMLIPAILSQFSSSNKFRKKVKIYVVVVRNGAFKMEFCLVTP